MMKLTTKRLKKLIREELAGMNIPDRYNAEAVDTLQNFQYGLDDKLAELNKGASQRFFEKNIKNYETLRKGIAQLVGDLKSNTVQMGAQEAMEELRMMVPGSNIWFN